MEIWITKERKRVALKDMPTSHIFNSIRMLYNNLAPEHIRIEGGRYKLYFSKEQALKAITSLIAELKLRQDITEDMWRQLRIMHENSRYFGGKHLLE